MEKKLTGPMSIYTFRHPALFLNAGEIEEVRNRLDREPWSRAFDRLIDSADAALRREPAPVEGEYVPEGRSRLFRDCGAVRDLGLAFALTGEERYARRAAVYLLTWSGAMSPRFPSASGAADLCAALSALCYGVDLIWKARGVTGQDKNQIAQWADDLACDLEAKPADFLAAASPWASLFFSAAALVVEDPRWFDVGFGGFTPLLPDLLEPDGVFRRQTGRPEGLQESLLTLKALTCLAEAARHQEIDLYNAEVDGRRLRTAFRRQAAFLSGREAWPGSDGMAGESHSETYEIAFRVWGDADFADVLRRRGRNAWDGRVLGPVVLTHGVELDRDR